MRGRLACCKGANNNVSHGASLFKQQLSLFIKNLMLEDIFSLLPKAWLSNVRALSLPDLFFIYLASYLRCISHWGHFAVSSESECLFLVPCSAGLVWKPSVFAFILRHH